MLTKGAHRKFVMYASETLVAGVTSQTDLENYKLYYYYHKYLTISFTSALCNKYEGSLW